VQRAPQVREARAFERLDRRRARGSVEVAEHDLRDVGRARAPRDELRRAFARELTTWSKCTFETSTRTPSSSTSAHVQMRGKAASQPTEPGTSGVSLSQKSPCSTSFARRVSTNSAACSPPPSASRPRPTRTCCGRTRASSSSWKSSASCTATTSACASTMSASTSSRRCGHASGPSFAVP
jgi:hypothetical protein